MPKAKKWNPLTNEMVTPSEKMPTMWGQTPPADPDTPVTATPGAMRKALTRLNAQKATELRARFLDAVESRIATIEVTAETPDEANQQIAAMAKGDMLRLLTDSEDRGYGKPTQKQELNHALTRQIDEDMSPETAAELYQREITRNR